MKIKVTQEHIHNGTPGDSECCPIALAVKEIFPNNHISVCKDCVAIDDDACNTEAISWFIDDFDRFLDVEPFEFELYELDKRCSIDHEYTN